MAIYPNDAVGNYPTASFSSMIDRKPDNGFSIDRKYNTISFTSEAGYEKTRLKSRRAMRSFDITYTNVSGIVKSAIESFYNDRSGEYETFYFDMAHLNETGIIRTKFDGPLTIRQVLSASSEPADNFYTISFKLQEKYD